jgi:hypothetical protein
MNLLSAGSCEYPGEWVRYWVLEKHDIHISSTKNRSQISSLAFERARCTFSYCFLALPAICMSLLDQAVLHLVSAKFFQDIK